MLNNKVTWCIVGFQFLLLVALEDLVTQDLIQNMQNSKSGNHSQVEAELGIPSLYTYFPLLLSSCGFALCTCCVIYEYPILLSKKPENKMW